MLHCIYSVSNTCARVGEKERTVYFERYSKGAQVGSDEFLFLFLWLAHDISHIPICKKCYKDYL